MAQKEHDKKKKGLWEDLRRGYGMPGTKAHEDHEHRPDAALIHGKHRVEHHGAKGAKHQTRAEHERGKMLRPVEDKGPEKGV